ncbi:MAG: hypothetical protein EHM78_02065 [Myxococcaceae bacterium]|nr:MAG: hypothetical protein EHM78_02065 [Myxococcaceae bacterium]
MGGKLHHKRGQMGLFNPVGALVHVGSERACLKSWAKLRGLPAQDGLDLAHLRVKIQMARWQVAEVVVAVLSPDADLSGFESGAVQMATPDFKVSA